jgi:hypothetical protein
MEIAILEEVLRGHEEVPFVARLLKLIALIREAIARQQLYVDLAKSIILEEEQRRGPKPPSH